jgi:hypothetical protein
MMALRIQGAVEDTCSAIGKKSHYGAWDFATNATREDDERPTTTTPDAHTKPKPPTVHLFFKVAMRG